MKKKALFVSVIVLVTVVLSLVLASCSKGITPEDYIRPVFKSENLIKGASITYETLKKGEKADAKNILSDDDKAWTPQYMNREPREGEPELMNSAVDIQLEKASTFNTALIEEIGNEVQYFRLMAWVDGAWATIYRSEKIQALRLLSFDSVTTDKIRLSIDKFRSNKTPAKIKSIALYNEPKRDTSEFNVTAYQRIDKHGDVPTKILSNENPEIIDNYARFYDVYNTVIVFGAVNWNSAGEMTFGEGGEENFATQIDALKKIIDRRSNKANNVRIVCTVIADGAFGVYKDNRYPVNDYMAQHYDKVADQIIEFMKKYELDGLDIDWEYPQTKDDWNVYDKFIAKLDAGMREYKTDAVLSAALSAGALGMSKATLEKFDQIQYMAYDGFDQDGYQSSLDQAQQGLVDFVNNGANLKQINIGIAAYGRPTLGGGFWPSWRAVENANYWDSKYYNVTAENGQICDAAFCAPALAGDKTAYALMAGVGGVMVFRMGCDKTMDDPNSVACGIENALKRYRA